MSGTTGTHATTRWWVASLTCLLALACAPTVADDDDDDDTNAAQHTALLATEPLPVDDADCPEGGVRILSGVDDGDGDGIADDGVLQPGEVDTSSVVCNGASPDLPTPASEWLDTTLPAGPTGTRRVELSGGRGTLRDGGTAGTILLTIDPPSPRGHVMVARTGSVDASFHAPTPVPALGPAGWTVPGDTTVPALSEAEGGQLPVGSVFLVAGSGRIVQWNGTDVVTLTGIHVPAGVTLTLTANRGDNAEFGLARDMFIEGTLTTALIDGTRQAGVMLTCLGLVTTSGSAIDLSGQDGDAATPGVGGGAFQVSARVGTPEFLAEAGQIVVAGRIDTSGGDGAPAGRAGSVLLSTHDSLTTTGVIAARGGDGLGEGSATAGGAITIRVSGGPWRTTADIDVSAGAGGPTGVDGGSVDALSLGVWHTGTFVGDGGTASACTGRCDGGDGGSLTVRSYAGPLLATGELRAAGGDGVGSTIAGGATGGGGGRVIIEQAVGPHSFHSPVSRLIALSVDMDLPGGAGSGSGGVGGTIEVNGRNDTDSEARLLLLGYGDMTMDGGDGAANATGGRGGKLTVRHTDASDGPAIGSAVVDVSMSALGGHGNVGGGGGVINLDNRSDAPPADPARVLTLTGTVDLSGGEGISTGGGSGQVTLTGAWGVRNEATILSVGGHATNNQSIAGASGRGIFGTEVAALVSEHGTIDNAGDLVFVGGDAVRRGGDGGRMRVVGLALRNTGLISVAGGAATLGDGGNGGLIFLDSGFGDVDLATGTLEVTGGVGDNELGLDGTIVVDGVDITAAWLP